MTLKDRIKAKLRSKIAKLKAKIGRKAGKSAGIAAAAIIPALMVGCQQTPSRSQQLTFEGCTFTVYLATNTPLQGIEIATQAMAIETSGNETQTASASASADYSPGRIDATVAE